MSDTQIPILTRAPEDTTDQVTDVMTELTEQTKFLSETLNKSIKAQAKTEKKQEVKDKKEERIIKSSPKEGSDKDIIKSAATAGVNAAKLAQETFLGDISFATEPIKKMSGILKDATGIFGFGKKKRPPKRSAMLKTNPEAVYITDTLLKDKEEGGFMAKLKDLLPLLFGVGGIAGLAKMVGPMLLKGGAIAALAAGLIWMAVDGIKGYFMAEQWGTSKAGAVIGAVLGGTGKGWKNAFKNAGKWALVGVGAGFLVAGPIGALVGGLLGAAIGGILGFIGGEKIAKGIDKIGKWFKNVFWGGIKKMAKTIGTWFVELPGMLAEGFKEGWEQFKTEMGAVANFAKGLWEKISPVFTAITDTVTDIFKNVVEGVKSFIKDPIGFGKELIKKIVDKVKGIFTSIKEGFEDFIGDPLGFISDMLQPIKDFFGKLGSIFGWIGNFFGGDTPEINQDFIDNAKSTSGYNKYFGGGTGGGSPIPHNDVIMRPDGSIHTTHPDDTIIATKNPIAFADKQSSSMTRDINTPIGSIMSNLETLVQELVSKQQVTSQSNVVQQNITSRYNPQAIMANLTTEVF